jgi:hypothetical protein
MALLDEMPRCLGLGDFAAANFTQSWSRDDERASDYLRRCLRENGRWNRSQVAYDARCLLASKLTSEELELIWVSCNQACHHPRDDGMSGRAWMELVASAANVDADVAAIEAFVVGEDSAMLARTEALVDRLEIYETLYLMTNNMLVESVRLALRNLAKSGFSELSLRLFLVMVCMNYMRLSVPLYAEIVRVSRDFGFPEHFLDEVKFRVVLEES